MLVVLSIALGLTRKILHVHILPQRIRLSIHIGKG